MNLNDCFFYFFFLLLILAFLFAFFFCSRLLLLSFFIRLIVLCDYLKSQSNELDWGCLIKYRFIFRCHTLLYHRILKCQVGSPNDSGCNGLQGLLTFYEHEPFFLFIIKNLQERIHNIYITFSVMYSFQVFHPKQIMLHICYGQIYWLNTQYVVYGLYEWFAWDRQYLTVSMSQSIVYGK